ncbi:MAG: murein transglycosylase A [Stellaceae bacterium]
MRRSDALLAMVLALAACTPRPPAPPRLTLEPTAFESLPGWQNDDMADAIAAFLRSCAALTALDPKTPLGPKSIAGTAGDWRMPCATAQTLGAAPGAAVRRFFENAFVPWRLGNNGNDQGLFTGYFEPELQGALARGGAYQTPLLKRPPDLVSVNLGLFRPDWRGERTAGRVVKGRLVPYPTRAQIERGVLDKEGLALLWVSDPVDAFILEIQGSGRVRLADGSYVNVGFDGQNGRAYVPIGRLLVERGALRREDASLASIRSWLAAHPGDAGKLMDENPSYVFFRVVKGEAPIGAEGVALTAGRSLAIDPTFLPLGVPLWLDLAQNGVVTRCLVIAQDTGGAIRGPVRGDLFLGFGAAAEAKAGTMRADGAYYLLLPRAVSLRRQSIAGAGLERRNLVSGQL